MYLSSYKTQQRIVYFSGQRRKFDFIILLHQTTKSNTECTNKTTRFRFYDFIGLSYVTSRDQCIIDVNFYLNVTTAWQIQYSLVKPLDFWHFISCNMLIISFTHYHHHFQLCMVWSYLPFLQYDATLFGSEDNRKKIA